MATTTDHTSNAVRRGYPANTSLNPMFTMYTQMDTAVYNKGSGDIGQMFDIAAGMIVLEIMCEVLTEEGGAATMDVGFTGGDVDGFLDAVDLNSAGLTWSGETRSQTLSTTNANVVESARTQVYGIAGGYRASAADTIDCLFNTAATAVTKFDLYAMVFDLKLASPIQ